MKRRDFFIRVGGAMIAVPAVLHLSACGDDDGGGGAADAAPSTSFNSSSTLSGHVHMVTVQCSDLSSSSDVTYASSTANAHTHQVVITAANLATIASGGSVTIDTTDGGHPHAWAVSRPGGSCPS